LFLLVHHFFKLPASVSSQFFFTVRIGSLKVSDGFDKLIFFFCDFFVHIVYFFLFNNTKIVKYFVLPKILVKYFILKMIF